MDYLGLQAVFNTLAKGGADAVNIYANEKGKQRQLEFDKIKHEDNRKYLACQQDQNQQRLDLTKSIYQDEKAEIRRKQQLQEYSGLMANASERGRAAGYKDVPQYLRESPEALDILGGVAKNFFGDALGGASDVKLSSLGRNKAGEDVLKVSYQTGEGKYKEIPGGITRSKLIGFTNRQIAKHSIPDILAQLNIKTVTAPSGKRVFVDAKGGVLKPEQTDALTQVNEQLVGSAGGDINDLLDNPPEQQLKQSLEKAYGGMPANARAKPTKKRPLTAQDIYKNSFLIGTPEGEKALKELPSKSEAFGGSLRAIGKGIGTVAGAVGGSIYDGVTDMAKGFVSGISGEAQASEPTEQKDTVTVDPRNTDSLPTLLAARSIRTSAGESVPKTTTPEATAKVLTGKHSNEVKALTFAANALRGGGPKVLANPQVQAVYHKLLSGGYELEAAVDAAQLAKAAKGGDGLEQFAKTRKIITEEFGTHLDSQATIAAESFIGRDDHKDRQQFFRARMHQNMYQYSDELKKIGLDIGRWSRHPETSQEIARIIGDYTRADESTKKHNKSWNWGGLTDRDRPNLTNYIEKHVAISMPQLAKEIAYAKAAHEIMGGTNPPNSKDELKAAVTSRSAEILEQMKNLPTGMDG